MSFFDNHPAKKISAILLALICIYAIWTSVYRNDATEISVFQAPITGSLSIEVQPGTYLRVGASVHSYRKQDNYGFEWSKDAIDDHSISVQFNDGGKAQIGGNIQWEMPTDLEHVVALHTLYGSQETIDKNLMRNAINRAMTFTAPLMSATESYAVRRAEFLSAFADQLENGIYQLVATDATQPDPITGEMKRIKLVSIQKDSTGQPIRSEESPLKKYGIHIQAPTITHIVYEDAVTQQIQKQRDNTLAIQTAQAESKKAEQAALTAAKNGEANAAVAKWEQEVIKAKRVTAAEADSAEATIQANKTKTIEQIKAEQEKLVAETAAQREKEIQELAAQRDLNVRKLAAETAEQYKREQTLMGEGDAARRSAVLAADGALGVKVDAWLKAQTVWANALGQYRGDMVPRIVTSSNGSAGGNGNAVADFMSLMSLKAANDLSLDMKVQNPSDTLKTPMGLTPSSK